VSTPPPTPPAPAALVDRARVRAWREAVLELRYAERRRVFPTAVHVGVPGARRATHVEPAHPGRRTEGPWDHALRTDVLGALLDRYADGREDLSPVPVCWVTRCGSLEGHDADADWLAAARAAYAEAGLGLALAVVTHAGWVEPASGASRTWKRLRRHPRSHDQVPDQSQAWTGSLECIRSR